MTATRRVRMVILGTVALLAACLVLPVDVIAETPTPGCGGSSGAVIAPGLATDRCEFVADGSRPTVLGTVTAVAQGQFLNRVYPQPAQVRVAVHIFRRSAEGSYIEIMRCEGSGLSVASCTATAEEPVEAGTRLTCSINVHPAYYSPQRRTFACGNGPS